MGMTIEEAHGILSNGLVNAPSEHEWCVAFIMAIDTLHKYQKIQEIMAKRPKDMISSNPTLRAISEVLEDGDVD